MFLFRSKAALSCEFRLLLFIGPADDPLSKSGRVRVALTTFLKSSSLNHFSRRAHVKIRLDVRESVCVLAASLPCGHLEAFLEHLTTALLDEMPTQSNLEAARLAEIGYAGRSERQPLTHLIGQARAVLFPGHSWEHRPHGTASTISTCTLDDVLAVRALMQRRCRAVFVCSPHLPEDIISKRMNPLHQPNLTVPRIPEVVRGQAGVVVRSTLAHIHQTHVLLAAVSHSTPGSVGLCTRIADELIGGWDYSSLLVSRLRRERALVYTTHSFLVRAPVAHIWGIHAECSPANSNTVIAEIRALLHNLSSHIDQSSLDDAVKRHVLKLRLSRDGPIAKMEGQLDQFAINGSLSLSSTMADLKGVHLAGVYAATAPLRSDNLSLFILNGQ